MHTCMDMKGDRNRLSVDSVGSKQCKKITSLEESSQIFLQQLQNYTQRGEKSPSGIITVNNLKKIFFHFFIS